jgi:AcrR family transcriptional regulator
MTMSANALESPSPPDGRALAGAARREGTRRRLLRAAVPIFAEQGTDGAVVDDFVSAAGVSRGTFYNYYATPLELLTDLVAVLSDEVVASMEPLLAVLDTPAARVACGTRAYIRLVTSAPRFATFVSRTGWRSGAFGVLTEACLLRDIVAAREQGWFEFEELAAARDLLHGASLRAIESIRAHEGTLATADESVYLAMLGLGLTRARARRILDLAPPAIRPVPDSLLAQVLAA